MKILCVDMDGVLAVWDDYYISIEEMSTPGFYENLQPSKQVIQAMKEFINRYGDTVEVHILSAAFNTEAINEKRKWLDKYLPEVPEEHRHFVSVGEDKSKVFAGHNMDDITLLDDYTRNLRNWKNAGGRGIKLLNGDNNVSGKWTGDYMYYRTETNIFVSTLYALIMKDT